MAEAHSTCACLVCGKAIKRKIKKNGEVSSRKPMHCSAACKTRARRDRMREAGTPIKQHPRFKDAACRLCGAAFRSRPNGKSTTGWAEYCCVRCGRDARMIRNGNHPVQRRHVVITLHGHCKQCGKHFIKGRPDTLYCSPACIADAAYGWRPSERTCPVCKGVFVQTEKWQATCSPACKAEAQRKHRRVGESRRRARIRGVACDSIDPIAVFVRDRWKCQLCGVRTPKRLRGTYEDTAPELDHIVTLADGGAHTWGNVQCACRRCNGAKGAASRGQLGLPFAA